MKSGDVLLVASTALLSACGFYPFGDEGTAPSASREQIVRFLQTCRISGARIERGEHEGETDWVVAMGDQPRQKWDCFNRESEKAGVMATAWGRMGEDT